MEEANKKWATKVYKVVWILCAVEVQKHLEPNFSQSFADIFRFLNSKYSFTDRKTTSYADMSDIKISNLESELQRF